MNIDETPRTTHALHGVWYRGDGPGAFPNFARQLEIETIALTKERDEARAQRDALLEGIRRVFPDFDIGTITATSTTL